MSSHKSPRGAYFDDGRFAISIAVRAGCASLDRLVEIVLDPSGYQNIFNVQSTYNRAVPRNAAVVGYYQELAQGRNIGMGYIGNNAELRREVSLK